MRRGAALALTAILAVSACANEIPGAPSAAPQTDGSCVDGACEVTLAPAEVIEFDPALRVHRLTVQSIDREEVTLLIPMIGTARFRCAGDDCSSSLTTGGNPAGRATTRAGGHVTANGVTVEVVAVLNGTARLHINPTG